MQKQTIFIDRNEYEMLQACLDGGRPIKGAKHSEILKTYNVKFGEGIDIDVQVCNGDRPYVSATLYDTDREVETLDPSEELLGEYPFSFRGDSFTVEISIKQKESKKK